MVDDRPDPDLYEQDFYAWTQSQAQALRAGAAGSNRIEWDRLAEEISDLGAAEKNKVRSALRNIIVHLLELETSGADPVRRHWRAEVLTFRADALDHLTNAMRREIEAELERLHARAGPLAQAKLDAFEPGRKIDPDRRWSLPELLGEAQDPLTALFPDEPEAP